MSEPHEGLTHLSPVTNFDDSNIALIGTQLDHSVHAKSAALEPAWKAPGVGTAGGLWAWVVEDFKLREYRQGDLASGDLKTGDSYIILQSLAKNDELVHNIYFWLGKESTIDEEGVAAYKSVELDEVLKGSATQHREVQSQESSSFLALFHPSFLVSFGGHASGFHHVSPFSTDSLHLSSRRLWEVTLPVDVGGSRRHQPRVQEVPAKRESITEDNVFILDAGDTVSQWNGGKSHPLERAKAAEVARSWVDNRDGKATLQVYDEGSGDTTFFLALGVHVSELPLHFTSRDAGLVSTISSSPVSFSLPVDNAASPSFTPFSRSQLIPSALLLLVPTLAHAPLYVWVGSKVTLEQKKSAFEEVKKISLAEKPLMKRSWHMVKEGQEDNAFWKALEV